MAVQTRFLTAHETVYINQKSCAIDNETVTLFENRQHVNTRIQHYILDSLFKKSTQKIFGPMRPYTDYNFCMDLFMIKCLLNIADLNSTFVHDLFASNVQSLYLCY